MKYDYDLIFLRFMIGVTFTIGIALIISSLFSSCTYSINMVHTQGEATDVVDETQSNEPDIKPNLSIPAL